MKKNLIAKFEEKFLKKKTPSFRPGDRVRVHYKIQEGTEKEKFRIQHYEGVVIRYRKGTMDSTFTVRKIGAGGVGVERVFPIHSPLIDKIDVLSSGKVRRARLFYLRDLTGKSARIKSRYVSMGLSADLERAQQEKTAQEAAAPEANLETETTTETNSSTTAQAKE